MAEASLKPLSTRLERGRASTLRSISESRGVEELDDGVVEHLPAACASSLRFGSSFRESRAESSRLAY